MSTAQESRLAIVIDTAGAEERIKELRKQLAELGGQADDTSDDLGDLGDNANNAGDGAGNLTSNSDKAKKSLDSLGKAAAIAGAALVGAIGLSVKKAMEFETAMAEVNKTVDFSTNTGLAQLKGELIELSRVIPLPFEELAAIAAAGGQVGVADTALRGFTETIAKMAIAFDITAAETATSMAKIASNYRVPIEDVANLGDAINALSNSTAANAGEIIDFMLRVGGAAKQLNITGEAAAAMGAQLVDSGKSVEVAGTAVSKVLQTIGNQDGWVKGQIEAFDSLGLATAEFSQLAAKDGVAALALIQEKVSELASDKQMGMLDAMFGIAGVHASELFLNAESLAEKLALVGEGAEKTTEHLGSMEEEFRKMSDTSANAMQLTKNMMDAAVASIGEAFLPVLNQLLQDIAPVIDKITEWATANPELIRTIALVSGALLGSIVSLKLAVDGFTAMKTTIEGLKLGYAALASPMGLTIIALGALLAAGVLVYQNWDAIKKVISENQPMFIALGVSVSALTVALIAANAPLILLKVQAAAAAVQAGIMTVATAGWSVAAGVAAAATWTFNAALAVLTSPIILVVAAIATIAFMGYQVVKNWAAISAGLNAEFNKIKSYVLNTVASMQAAWDRGVANTRGAIINIKNTIVTTLKELPSRMLQIGKDIVMGLVNGIKSGASGVTTAISSMASSAVAKAKSVLDIRSPSRVMKKVGEQTAEGMAKGIKKGAKAVKTEAQKMAEGAIKAVQDGVASLKREIALFGNDSALAALDYDIKVGKFGGANTGELRSLTQTKEQLELSKKLADANKSVQDSIDGLIKQQALFGNGSSLASLMYDIEHTEKYKGITQELTDKLIEQTRAFEQLGMTAKATDAIKARFAQLTKDQGASTKAVDGVMTELVNESPMAKIQADYDRRLAIITENEMLTTGIINSETEKRAAIEEAYMTAKQQLMLGQSEAIFSGLAGMAKGFLGEQSGVYRALYVMQKAYALSSALLSSKKAIMDAWSNTAGGYFAKAAAAGQVLLSTSAITSAIAGLSPKGFKSGGYTGNGGASQVAGVVHGQEYVFDAQATKRIGVDNLNAMRSGKSVGGGDVNINVNVNVDAKGNANVSGDNERMGRDMANGIKAVVMDVMRKEKRQGGMLYGA